MERSHSGHTHSSDTPYHEHDELDAAYFGLFHHHHGDHTHDDEPPPTPEQLAALGKAIWDVDNVELTTVGVDVGSSTSHLMFARVHLQRLKEDMSSRFVVVNREILWCSPILLTPYRPDNTINAERLQTFFKEAYAAAGLEPSAVDAGAVILTGEALKRSNARAIADLFAAETGKFVCASAGHHLEALLAAQGSGALLLSRQRRQNVLNVDIGGGTSKFALVHDGQVLHTAAVAMGGRLVAFGPDGGLVRIEGPARQIAEAAGVELALGEPLPPEARARLVRTMVDVLASLVREEPSDLARALLVTAAMPRDVPPEAIAFSGGVAEYVYGRETTDYGDLAPALAVEVRAALADGRIALPLLEPAQRIRATVIGASQFSVQLSGNTIFISDTAHLPLHNLPVLFPPLDPAAPLQAEEVAAAIRWALKRFDLHDGHEALALAFRWSGDPLYARLRALAEGIVQGLPHTIEHRRPLVLLLDGDVGKTLGHVLKDDLRVASDVISIDGMQLKEFDYIDVGALLEPQNVVPVVIKSLLFAAPGEAVGGELLAD
ncbi:MAG TPA: ethanolamine ammonia-lyase reactivating factor EutA [Chloroflexota bacterium]|nr:ethanolamine ammonia-lyase reactivating factor EutA [Chloroflexota bacterium]